MYTCAWIAVRGVIKVVNFTLARIWIRFRVCSPARNDGTSENKVTSYCFKEQEGRATLACAGIAINPRMCLQLRPLRNHFGAKPPSPTRIPGGLELLLTRNVLGREGRGRCGYATVGSARSLSRKSDALVITCSHEYSIARGIINSSNMIKSTAKLLYTADSRNDYPSNLSQTYLPRPALGPRSLKLTEVVLSLRNLLHEAQKHAFFTHKTTLSQEHSGARTPPVRYPFTRSSTNTGFRSDWKRGWVSNNLNNFTIAPAFARHSRNKLYPRNFKIDDRAADTYLLVRFAFPSVALNDRIFRKVGYEKDKYNQPIETLT
ncbi:hypothetical protein ALC60_01970 [Trachymyrmex zeteki]|uniref:Uncharacterized protein n=1 Tax=Mycetomoellerius zeteki TaxID=64791 RepID=A0A151XF66_9HYME|nr:hypothetical protein ALC60_01970 [Trachymyrmex zeteki]